SCLPALPRHSSLLADRVLEESAPSVTVCLRYASRPPSPCRSTLFSNRKVFKSQGDSKRKVEKATKMARPFPHKAGRAKHLLRLQDRGQGSVGPNPACQRATSRGAFWRWGQVSRRQWADRPTGPPGQP